MEKKKYKPNLKDTARRAKIIADIKEFEKIKNVPNSERLKKGVDAPVQIPITPQGKHRGDSENHAKWGALDVGIAHLPDDVQAEFIEFMVDKGHRVYDERDEISKDPDKQALGLRAGIVHIDDNVEEEVLEPEKNFVPEKGDSKAYEAEYGDNHHGHGTGGVYSSSRPQGYGSGSGGGTYMQGAPPSRGGGGASNQPQAVDWGKKYRDAEEKRKKAEEEMAKFKEKVGDYETKYAELDKLKSVPYTEQRKQLVRLSAAAKGVAPSEAEKAMKKTQSEMLQQNIGFMKSQRRGAGGMKQFFRTAEKMGTMGQQQAGLMRMREKAMAEQALGGSVSEMTGQALKLQLQEMGLDAQKEIAKIQAEAAKYGANLQAQAAAQKAQGSMIGGLLGGIGSIAGMAMFGSDKNMKKKIKREDLYKNEYGDSYPGYESEKGDSSRYGKHSLSLKERKKQSQDELDKIGFKRIKEARKKSGNKSFQAARVKPKEIETIEKKWGVWDEKGDSKIHKPVNVTPQDLLKKKTKRKKAVKYEKGEPKKFKAHEMIDPSTKKKYWANTYKKHKKYEKKGYVHEKGEPKDFSPKKFLDALKPNSYEYKDEFKKNPMGGEGRFLGIMAQDLEKAGPVGKSMVEDTPMGKLVNYGKGFGAVLAAQAHLNQRLKALESGKKKRK